MPVLHVVIPCFNEGETLEACVKRVMAAPLPAGWRRSVILVDDASAAPTQRISERLVEQLRTAGEEVQLVRHPVNQGKGAALRSGFDLVLQDARDEDAVIIQDADLEYDPTDYPSLLQPIIDGQADAVFGNRWSGRGSSTGVKSRLHAAGNRWLTGLSNRLTGYRLFDMECCYKVLPAPLLRQIRPCLTENRFGVEPQIAAALARLNARIEQVPVSYHPRTFREGKKIGWIDGVRAVYVMWRERR